jgi:hypothetical protein
VVHHICPVGGGHGQGVQECSCGSHVLVGPGEGRAWRPLIVDGCSDGPGPSSDLGEVDYCGPLCLDHGLAVL